MEVQPLNLDFVESATFDEFEEFDFDLDCFDGEFDEATSATPVSETSGM